MRNGVAHGRVLKAVAKTWPGFIVNAVESRARQHIDAGRYEEAAAEFERAARRYGSEAVPRLMFAWTLGRLDRYEESHEWAALAAETEADNPDAHWVLGSALQGLGRKEEAEVALRKSIELEPGNGFYHIELALIDHEDRDFDETRELVDRAVELSPDDATVHHLAASVFDHHFRHRRAQYHLERALELEPERAEARHDLSAVLYSRGRISLAVRHVLETVPDPGTEELHRHRYDASLRRWSWRWYEWALRAALVLNVVDWIFPTPFRLGLVLLGVGASVFAVRYARTLASLPPAARRDLLGSGRRLPFAAASVRTLLVMAGTGFMLLLEPSGWIHLGVLAAVVLGYVDWYRRAVRIAPE